MPTVVNRHRYLPVHGLRADGSAWSWGPEPKPLTGRERRPPMPDDAVYVGRGAPLGNPFRREQFGDGAIGLYRRWLAIALGTQTAEAAMRGVEDVRARWLLSDARPNDPRVMMAMRSIGPDTLLVCSCSPRPCHGDVVASAWQYLRHIGRLAA